MKEIPKVDVPFLKANGYVLVKGLFSKEEMSRLRAQLEVIKERALASNNHRPEPNLPNAVFIFGDVLAHRELREWDYVIFDDRIIGCGKQILGPKIVYFGDSSIQTGEGGRGFHKDNVDRSDVRGPDWQSDYTLMRFGVYFQDHARHSGGLKVRAKSHGYASHHHGKAVNVPSELGDLVIWNLRTTHSGNNVRLRGLPGLCLHPRVEAIVPTPLRVAEQAERYAMFATYAAPGRHLERYLENMVRRGDYHDYLIRAGFDSYITALANRKGIEMRRPIANYGTRYPYYEASAGAT